jgi:hypothetical protein
MNKLRNMLVAMIAITGLSTSAFAGSMSIGLVGSNLSAAAKGTETDRITAAGANIADTSTRSLSKNVDATVGTIYVEYTTDFRFPIALGVEYTPGQTEIHSGTRSDTELSVTGTSIHTAKPSTRQASAEMTNFATAYIEVPIYKGLYVKGGLANMTVNHKNDSGLGAATHLKGTNTGVGYKITTAGGYILKASYEETDYDTISLRSSNNSVAANSTAVSANVDTEAYRVSIGKSF